MQTDNAQTDSTLFFRTMDTCPINKKVQLLNKAGIATTGWWDGKEKWYIGWFPIPKIPDNLKKEIVGDTRT